MKLRSLSIVAAGAILGLGLLSGCGGGSSGAAGAASSGIGASDGYVIKLDTNATAFCSDTNLTHTSLNTVGAKGALTFSGVTLTDKCIVTVPADAWIDADNNGSFNATVDKQVGFAMRAPGDAKFVSQLTTYAVDANNTALMALVKDFDPVVAAVSATSDNNTTANNAKKLLILGEALKTAYAGGSSEDAKTLDVSEITDVNVTADSLNIGAITASYTGGAAAAITAKATAMQALVDILGDLKTAGVDVADVAVQVSDGGKSLAQALIADGNKTLDGNLTAAVSAVDTNITHATTAVNALPAKLSIGSLKLGNQTVTLNGNTFNTTVTTTTASISDFYDVSFPSVSLTKGFADDAGINVTVTLSNGSNQVTMSIAGATLKAIDNNTSVGITLPANSTVTVSQTGLSTLQGIIGTSAQATIGTELVMSDLGFNIGTVLDALTVNATPVSAAIAALDDYIKTSNVYDVNISFVGIDNLVTDHTSFAGKVTVKGIAPNTAPTLGVSATTAAVTAGQSTTITLTPADVDGNIVTVTDVESNSSVATATISGTTLTITGVAAGTATITLTPNDGTVNGTPKTVQVTVSAAPAPSVAFDTAMVHNAVNGSLSATENTSGSYTLKAKTSAVAPTSTGTAVGLFVSINGGTAVSVPVSVGYAAGTTFQIGVYSGTTLVAVSSIYTLTQDDITATETIGNIAVTVQ